VAEIVLSLPDAPIWSPSNTAGSWDHEVLTTPGRAMIVECKAIVSNASRDPTAAWRIPIDQAQLDGYLYRGLDPNYLLPACPPNRQAPWIRYCIDGLPDGTCSACAEPLSFGGRRAAA
jgi:hypothetical protein